ncbi:MAG: hypothetical protein PHI66_04115 [Candidatus Pacebacteria bacterium]|nr:hypothetical protein [Candidatus Paceibacterota bacterium]
MITKANLDTALAKLEDKIERKTNLRLEQLRDQLGGEIKNLEAKNEAAETLASREEGLPDDWKDSFEKLAEEIKSMKIRIVALEEIAKERGVFLEETD